MSCSGGNSGCGAGCKSGSGCGGCKMYPDFTFSWEKSTGPIIIICAPEKGGYFEMLEMTKGSENEGCGRPNCNCTPCNCTNCQC